MHFQKKKRPRGAEIRFRAKTIVTSLSHDIYSNRLKTNIIIKLSLCAEYMCYSVFTIKINLFKYIYIEEIQRWKVYQGRRSSYQSAGADPLLLKCSWRGREAVVELRALKMVFLVPTQYFNTVTTHQFCECFSHFKVCLFFPFCCLEPFFSHR